MGIKQFFHGVGNVFRNISYRSQQVFSLLNGDFARWWVGADADDLCKTISTKDAMRQATVFTCVLVRAESLSTMPASVKQDTDQGSRTAYEHPVYNLIHNRPNPFQTAADFWKTVCAHIDLYGNCFAVVTYTRAMRPNRLDIVCDPLGVQIMVSDSGDAYYQHGGKRYAFWEMLHFKDLSLDGYYGISKIGYNAETIGYGKKLKKYGSNAIGTKPPGYFSTEAHFDVVKKQEGKLQDGWRENIDTGKTPVLPFGLKYNPLMITPSDAQYLEAISATDQNIYGIFRVPPSLAQNYQRATWANAEQQDLTFVKYTLLPIVTNIEQECNSKLFAESNATSRTPYYVKFNASALLRGDFKTRTEGYRTLFNIGAISGDQIAELEDWNKWEGGDRRYVPANMIPVDRVDDFVDTMTEPATSSASDPGGSQQQRALDHAIKLNGHHKTNGHEA
jgi:HK97 family phage portal protein